MGEGREVESWTAGSEIKRLKERKKMEEKKMEQLYKRPSLRPYHTAIGSPVFPVFCKLVCTM